MFKSGVCMHIFMVYLNLLMHFTRRYFSMFYPLDFQRHICESFEGAGLVKLMAFHFVSSSERLRPSSQLEMMAMTRTTVGN